MAPQAMIPSNTSGASSGAAPLFSGAPLAKLLVCTWISVFFLERHFSWHFLALQFWAFDTTGDLVMGLGYLALQLRRLEREIGSLQFAEFCLLTIPIGFVSHQILLILFAVPSTIQSNNIWSFLPPLPTLLMAASLHWYSYHTPRLYPNFISVFGGMKFSEKALMQLWGVYLLMHHHNGLGSEEEEDFAQESSSWWWASSNFGTTTLSYLLSGIMSSTLYFSMFVSNSSSTAPPLVLLPSWLVDKMPVERVSHWLDGILLDPPPRIYAPTLSGRGVPTRQRQPQQQAPRPQPRPAPVEPSPEAVAQLVAMGFPEDQVTAALRQTNNNVERAADRLLMGS